MALHMFFVAAVGTGGVLLALTGLRLIRAPRRLWKSWYAFEHRWRMARFGGGWTHLKRAEDGDGVVVRLYNTLDGPASGRLRLTEPWEKAELVNMNEASLGAADVAAGWARLSLRRNEIVTLRFA